MKKEKTEIYPYTHPLRIVAIYACLLMMWISLSNYYNFYNEDETFNAFISDVISGSVFVLFSSAVLYFFLKKNINIFRAKQNEILVKSDFLNTIIETAPYAVLDLYKDGRVASIWNKSAEKIFGWKTDEVIGKFLPIVPEAAKEEFIERLSKCFVNDELHFEMLPRINKKGETVYVNLTTCTHIDTTGNLRVLAFVEDVTEKKKNQNEIRKLSEALRQNPNAIILTDTKGIINYVNPAFEKQTGYSFDEAFRKNPMSLLSSDKTDVSAKKEIGEKISTGNVWKGEFLNRKKSGEQYWASVQIGPIKDSDGNIISCVAIEQDITEKKQNAEQVKQSLDEKEVMLKEIHHRVKNNLQVISSLLKMQSENHSNAETVEALKVSRSRIVSMALVHENLYNTPDLASIDMKKYIDKLSMNIFAAFGVGNNKVAFHSDVNNVKLGLDTAIPLGLMMNEIITNSLKHAFPSSDCGEINVKLEKDLNEYFHLCVKDTGIGIPKDFLTKPNGTLGKQLIKTLCSQLDGEMHINNGCGTEFLIDFKELKYKRRV